MIRPTMLRRLSENSCFPQKQEGRGIEVSRNDEQRLARRLRVATSNRRSREYSHT
ncbi:hypothetical protein [Fictibacillus barbaricus]|uniref:Uncharacterized protein n=1 Tax=Fictibacillus barbaricus TaxID=182136 RepID=A0ABS2ZA67_9BACL|nr:hypothetical protein [Fictibacillus barbaricus]MBN3544621.1 hypothetical protein [Fictibacillus barbaricus]